MYRRRVLVIGLFLAACGESSLVAPDTSAGEIPSPSAPQGTSAASVAVPSTIEEVEITTTTVAVDPRVEAIEGAFAALGPRQRLAQLIVAGFPGTSADETIVQLNSSEGIGGFIYFAANVTNGPAVTSLNQQLACLQSGVEPWIAVDQEPGNVARLSGVLPDQPTPAELGAAVTSGEMTTADIEALGRAQGEGLAGLGFSIDLAPVADVARVDVESGIDDPSRIFGADPALVGELAAAYVTGLESAGVAAVTKHFPGIGAVPGNPDEELPTIDVPLEDWVATDRPPFQAAIAAGTTGVMVTGVLLPALDADLPVEFSPTAIGDVLRGDLGFQGLVVTDDLQSAGIATAYTTAEAALAAAQAGADIILFADGGQVALVLDTLEASLTSGGLDAAVVDTAVRRVLEAKYDILGPDAFDAEARCGTA